MPKTPSEQSIGGRRGTRLFYIALGLITLFGCGLRVAWIDHPMRYDEAYSAVYFVVRGDWFNYVEPNNHVLNTLLMQVCAWLWGFSPPVLRLPAFLCGLATISASAYCALMLCGKKAAALLAAGFVACSSILVEYSTNARGYSMVGLATLVMVIFSIRLAKNPHNRWLWLGWGNVAVSGVYAVPTMLQSIVLASVVILLPTGGWKWKDKMPGMIVTLAAAGAVSFCLYLPVIRENGLKAVVANRWITPEATEELPADFAQLVSDLWNQWTRDTSPLTLGLIGIGVTGSMVGAIRQRKILWLVSFFAIAVMCLFILLQWRVPPARACMYILPLVLTTAGVGIVYLCEIVSPRWQRPACMLCGLLALAGWFLTAQDVSRRDYMISEDPGTCVHAEAVVKLLADRDLYTGSVSPVLDMEVSAPFLFYFYVFYPADGRFPPHISDPACKQAYIILRHLEGLKKVYWTTPHLHELYKSPRLVAAFPTAVVFRCERK